MTWQYVHIIMDGTAFFLDGLYMLYYQTEQK